LSHKSFPIVAIVLAATNWRTFRLQDNPVSSFSRDILKETRFFGRSFIGSLSKMKPNLSRSLSLPLSILFSININTSLPEPAAAALGLHGSRKLFYKKKRRKWCIEIRRVLKKE
jgi:hypothetical protein